MLLSNLYTRQICTRPLSKVVEPQGALDNNGIVGNQEEPSLWTNGGFGWIDVSMEELRAWIGARIYMGIKHLPIVSDYWSKLEEVLGSKVIPCIMTMSCWEAIFCCLHLTDNTKLDRDPFSLGFDKAAKVWSILEHFVERS